MPDPRFMQPAKIGKYTITRSLGQGAMGVVYEGFDTEVDRLVAVKTIKSQGLDGEQFAQLVTRLRREAQAAGRLHHTNITSLYEFGVDTLSDAAGVTTPTPFIAMEFIDGQDLAAYFRSGHSMSVPEIKRLIVQLLAALDYAHARGVIHRDIKPSNIVRMTDGTIKLTDFGIAHLDSSTLTQTGSVLGTPCYMAPEQFRGETVDARADLYAAGVVLFQLLTGEVPFDGTFVSIMFKVLNEAPKPPSLLNAGLPKEFDAIVLRAIAKNPGDRFASAEEFRRAVLGSSAGERKPDCEANIEPTVDRKRGGSGSGVSAIAGGPWVTRTAAVLGVSAVIAAAAGWLMRGPSASNPVPVAASAANPSANTATHVESAPELEETYWNHIKDSRDAANFKEYARRFPKGAHAAEATLVRRKLQPKPLETRDSSAGAPASRPAATAATTRAPPTVTASTADSSDALIARATPPSAPPAQAAQTFRANLGRLPAGTYAAGYTMRSQPGSRYPTRFTFFGEGKFYALGQRARIDGTVDLSNENFVACSVTMTDLNQTQAIAQSCSGRLSGGILHLQIFIGTELYRVAIDATRRIGAS